MRRISSTPCTATPPHAPHFISEVEVFCGRIIGKDGAQNKRQREFSTSMKDKHERDVEYTVRCIQQGEEEDQQDEGSGEKALRACMWDVRLRDHIRGWGRWSALRGWLLRCV